MLLPDVVEHDVGPFLHSHFVEAGLDEAGRAVMPGLYLRRLLYCQKIFIILC
jgi:hypothetical protein